MDGSGPGTESTRTLDPPVTEKRKVANVSAPKVEELGPEPVKE
jgi:hypothetical protein